MKIHASGEDYLEAILVLQKKMGMVRSIDLARHMGFSKPSISHAVGVLKNGGFLTVDDDGFLHLTVIGREIAEKIYERHLSVRRAWRTEHNRPVISTVLKTPAAKRDIPIPKCLVDCLRETKENSISDYVIADSKGEPLAASQFQRVWQYVVVRSTKPRNYYKYVNGQSIKYTVTPTLGMTQKNQPKIRYTLDFDVTPHQLRHTYITNLLYAGVDPKTVQYLAGHENSKTTMDIYAKVKYNKPEELFGVVNGAFQQAIAE